MFYKLQKLPVAFPLPCRGGERLRVGELRSGMGLRTI